MTDDSTAEDGASPGSTDGVDADRYARLSLDDGAVIVYDRTRTSAWIQSDVAVTLPRWPPVGPAGPAGGDTDTAEAGGE